MLAADAACPYALGASVFGPSQDARRFAGRVSAGCVVVNDLIAPTADPRIPFGGRGASGYGVTRGEEGLLAMTHCKAVLARRRGRPPQTGAKSSHDAALFRGYLEAAYGDSVRRRLGGLGSMIAGAWRRRRELKEMSP